MAVIRLTMSCSGFVLVHRPKHCIQLQSLFKNKKDYGASAIQVLEF